MSDVCSVCLASQSVEQAKEFGVLVPRVFLCSECDAVFQAAKNARAVERFLGRWPQLKSRVPKS